MVKFIEYQGFMWVKNSISPSLGWYVTEVAKL
jgi:hypothetical protein